VPVQVWGAGGGGSSGYTTASGTGGTLTSTGGWVPYPDSAWQWWNTTTTTVSTNIVWEYWNTPYVSIGAGGGGAVYRVPTAEERAESEAREQQYRAALQQRQEVERQANVTARVLLESLLSPQQLVDLAEHKHFDVLVPSGRRYRIKCRGSKSGNVMLMDGLEGENAVASFCAHLYGKEPTTDSYIAQMLALQDDEEGFLAVANMSRYRHDIEIPAPQRARELRAA